MTSLEKRQFHEPPFAFFIWLIVFKVFLVLLWNGRELQIIMGGFSYYNRLNWFFKWWEFIVTFTTVTWHTWKHSIMKLQLVLVLVLYNSWQKVFQFYFSDFFHQILQFFNCCLAAPRPIVGLYWGDGRTNPIVITTFERFQH